MKKIVGLLALVLAMSFLLSSCRPPELEGAFVDFKAGRFDNALKLAKIATEKYPTNAEAWYLLGELYGKKEQYPEMVHAFNKSLEIGKQFESKIKRSMLYYFGQTFNRAVNYYNTYTKSEDRESEQAKANLANAIKYFKFAKTIKNDYKTTNLIAVSYGMLGEKDSALVYYQELTKIAPDSAEAWVALGNFYFVQQDWKKAAEVLKKALDLDPKNVEAVTLISQCYDQMQDYDKAIEAYEQAKKLNPKEKAFPYNLGLIYYKLTTKEGISEDQKKEYMKKAIENYGEVIALDPNVELAYEIKSISEINLGMYDDALQTLTKALEHFPENGTFWYNLGVVYSHKNNAKEAKAAFKKAKEFGVE